MAKRQGVIVIMYDLPVSTAIERREALGFRKWLLKMGYIDIQKSIYVKMLHNQNNAIKEIQTMRKMAPKSGSIFALPLSVEQFRRLIAVIGEPFNMSLFADDVLVI